MLKSVVKSIIFVISGLMLSNTCVYSQTEQITINKSDTVIDGNGGLFNGGKLTYLVISSTKTSSGWMQTKNVTIKNCKIIGGVRIIGLGKNGQAADVKESSLSLGHTERAQATAPSNIKFSNVTFETSDGMTLLYIAPGTTYVTVENCAFTGINTGSGPIVYMDAESGHNIFRNNTFSARSTREVIACDGSAFNVIEENEFNMITKGGIYLYRNCGEGGTVRHQSPNHNTIRNNTFNLSNLIYGNYGIWLGSRNGNKSYCEDDAGYPFGSSIDNSDFADDNIVNSNTFTGGSASAQIKNDGENNQINATASTKPDTAVNEPQVIFLENKIVFSSLKINSPVKVFDTLGRVVFNEIVNENVIDFSLKPKGLCFVQFSGNDKIVTRKLIVN